MKTNGSPTYTNQDEAEKQLEIFSDLPDNQAKNRKVESSAILAEEERARRAGTVCISVFDAPVSNTKIFTNVTWPELCELARTPVVIRDNSAKEKSRKGRYLIRGIIEDGTTRNDDNLGGCCLLFLDIDKPLVNNPLPLPSNIHKALKGIRHIVHTTATPGRCRIIFYVDEYLPSTTKQLTRAVYNLCRHRGLNFELSAESKTLSQPMFLPQATDLNKFEVYIEEEGDLFTLDMAGSPTMNVSANADDNGLKDSLGNGDNLLVTFLKDLKSGTIHEAAKKYAGWKRRTSSLSTQQIFDEITVFIDEHCNDPEKIQRWHASERTGLEKWFSANIAGLDEHLAGISLVDENGKKKPKVTVLIEIGKAHELFHDSQRTGYSTIKRGTHFETWPLDSGNYKAYLSDQYFKLTQQGCSKYNVNDAIDTLRGAARKNGSLHSVYRRTAGQEGIIFIDLGDPDWRVVEVTAEGWRVVDHSLVKFIRSESTSAFPEPVHGGNINTLFRFLNVRIEDRPLVLGYLVRALNPEPPYFGLGVTGEQGTAKSTTSTNLRNCSDPSTSPLRPPPRDERDFLSGAVNNWVLCYDNLSGLQSWMADALCRVLTGGSFASRTLYTTNDETTIPLARPVILNGIDDLTERGDLADRCIVLNLLPIPESERLDERRLGREWDEAFPKIFGALLDGLSSAIRNVDKVVLPSPPRMVDAAMWATAAEEGFNLPPGAFMEAYSRNQSESVGIILNASPFPNAIVHFIRYVGIWEGSLTQLLETVSHGMSDDALKSKAWPKNPEWAGRYIRRFAPALRKIGIKFDDSRDADRRIIRMSVISNNLTPHSNGKGISKKENQDSIKDLIPENAVIAENAVTPITDQVFQNDSNDSNDSNDGDDSKLQALNIFSSSEVQYAEEGEL